MGVVLRDGAEWCTGCAAREVPGADSLSITRGQEAYRTGEKTGHPKWSKPSPAMGRPPSVMARPGACEVRRRPITRNPGGRSEEHTSELQSRGQLVCRLLLE